MSEVSKNPTSFDILKTIATFTLIFDHFGFFFYNDIEIFRIIGSLGYLLFIFCYGYNRKYHFDVRIFSLTALMLMNRFIMDPEGFELSNISEYSILISVIAAQIFMYFMVPKIKEDNVFAWLVLLEILAIPTRSIFQFGSEGIIICICGYICATLGKDNKTHHRMLAIALIFYVIAMLIDHHFSFISIVLLVAIFIGLWKALARFETYLVNIPGEIVLFISKYSLLIFYVHYELFLIFHWAFPKIEL